MPPSTLTAPATHARPAKPSLDDAAGALDTILRQLIAEHEGLLKVATLHRAAIGNADVRSMADCLSAQAAAADRISELERQRQTVVARFTGSTSPSRTRVTITQLAAGLSESMRTRLLAAADKLREVLNRLHQEHLAIRTAAESLSSHMEGLMRQVCRRLSHAGTYARTGNVDANIAVTTALDIRS